MANDLYAELIEDAVGAAGKKRYEIVRACTRSGTECDMAGQVLNFDSNDLIGKWITQTSPETPLNN